MLYVSSSSSPLLQVPDRAAPLAGGESVAAAGLVAAAGGCSAAEEGKTRWLKREPWVWGDGERLCFCDLVEPALMEIGGEEDSGGCRCAWWRSWRRRRRRWWRLSEAVSWVCCRPKEMMKRMGLSWCSSWGKNGKGELRWRRWWATERGSGCVEMAPVSGEKSGWLRRDRLAAGEDDLWGGGWKWGRREEREGRPAFVSREKESSSRPCSLWNFLQALWWAAARVGRRKKCGF